MATYKDLVGTAVRNNAGNIPTAETGQVFFDSTNIDFKYQFSNTLSSWRSGNALNTGRLEFAGGGTQTSAIVFGGTTPPGRLAIAETYDGISLTEVADLGTARNGLGGAGASSTSALAFGGGHPADSDAKNNTELWNGSAWTELGGDLNVARCFMGDAGDASNALIFGGYFLDQHLMKLLNLGTDQVDFSSRYKHS